MVITAGENLNLKISISCFVAADAMLTKKKSSNDSIVFTNISLFYESHKESAKKHSVF